MAKTRILVAMAACAAVVGLVVLVNSPFGARIWPWKAGHNQSALSEAEMATRDHVMITNAINELCEHKPYTVLASNSTSLDLDGSTSNPHKTFFQETAINYSAEIRDRRILLAQQIRENDNRRRLWEVLAACFGGLATIAVGIKPVWEKFWQDRKVDYVNGLFASAAIIFSAFVTLSASMSALTPNQDELLHNQRTLAQLQQLHWRVGNDVFAATELCNEKSADLKKVESWKDRFEQIANDAMAVISQPQDLRDVSSRRP